MAPEGATLQQPLYMRHSRNNPKAAHRLNLRRRRTKLNNLLKSYFNTYININYFNYYIRGLKKYLVAGKTLQKIEIKGAI